MSQRRMFSPQIVDSDAFLDMPSSAQNLYFHLGMRADDDGFVGNPKKILKMVSGSDDDLKILIAKRFILSFESGVIVIKHWLIHNQIRKDRYTETQYLDEKKTLRIKDNKAYTDSWQPNGNQLATQVRLGKDSIDKIESETKVSHETSKLTVLPIESSLGFPKPEDWDSEYWEDRQVWVCNGTPIKQSEINARRKEYENAAKRAITTAKAQESRNETMTMFSRNAVKLLTEAQKISHLDGRDNYKYAESVKKKIMFDLKQRGLEVPEDDIGMVHQLKLLLERISRNEFHWRNLTSFAYFDKNFNKIIRDVL